MRAALPARCRTRRSRVAGTAARTSRSACATAAVTSDVTRTPNEHVGFGGPGPHHCLGANLARREMRVMFREIFARLPDLEITGPPEMLRSNFIHGIKRMPCAFRAGGNPR